MRTWTGWKHDGKIHHMNTKKADVAILISAKVDLEPGVLQGTLQFILS